MSDFDREEERREEEQEEGESAQLAVLEFGRFARERTCVFVDGDDGPEAIHGRLIGLLKEVDALVIRDLRPGREKLGCRLLIPYDNLLYVCCAPGSDKCKECGEYKKLNREAARKA